MCLFLLLFFKGCHLSLRGERSAPCLFSSLVRGWVPSLSMGAQLWPKSAHNEVTWIWTSAEQRLVQLYFLLSAYFAYLWVGHRKQILLAIGSSWWVWLSRYKATVTSQLYLWGFVSGWSDKLALVYSTERGNVWNPSRSWLQVILSEPCSRFWRCSLSCAFPKASSS